MQATPIRTDVAREFLAEQSKDVWDPEATVIYDTASLPRPSPEAGNLVDVTLTGANRIDERGSWQGAVGDDDLHFTVLEEDGEFRIAGPPDALIVPQSWYAQRFRQVLLYFFDPTSQVLVPDPVFVPRNADLASTLVQRLIAGPAPDLVDYSHNAAPDGCRPRHLGPGLRRRRRDGGHRRRRRDARAARPGPPGGPARLDPAPGPVGAQPERLRRRRAGHARRPARGQRDHRRGVRPLRRGRQPAPVRPRGRTDGRGQRPEPRRGGRSVRPGRPGPAVDHARPQRVAGRRGHRGRLGDRTSVPSGPPPSRRRSRPSSPGPPTCWSRPGTSPTGSGWSTAGRRVPS